MQFSTFALSALSISSALAASTTSASSPASTGTTNGAVKVHVVKVGGANGTLVYQPNSLAAAVGDMVQFQFAPANHTVTQSTFAQPCQPINMNDPNTVGIYSGFMPVSATSATTPTYTIQINSTAPIWLYCSQGKHCQNGMTMVINVNASSNKTLAAFQALAKQATQNLPGNVISGGSGSGTTTTDNSNNSTGTGTTDSSAGTTTSGSAKATSSSAAGVVRASEAMGFTGLLAVVAALLL